MPVIKNKLKSKIIGNLAIEGEEDTDLNYLQDRIIDFRNQIGKMESFVLCRGEACILADELEDDEIPGETKISLTVYPLSRYVIKRDALGRIYDALFYKELFNGQTHFTNYLFCEHRFYKVRDKVKIPFSEFIVIKNMWNNNLGFWTEDIKQIKLEEDDLPEDIKEQLGDIEINKPKELKKLGVYRFKNSEENELAPYSDIGESQFINATGFMMALETSMTYQEIDKYIGRGRALIPQLTASNGLTRGVKESRDNILDYSFMTPYKAQAGSLDAKTPVEAVQFALRTDEWKISMETAEAKVCVRCGISVIDFDTTITASVQRTATEVNYLNDITANTVKEKRALIKSELDRMISDICEMLELNLKAFVVFDPSTIIDTVQLQSQVAQQYSNGLISLETAIKTLHPNWKPVEVQAEIDRINLEQDSKSTAGAFDQTFGV